MNSPSKSWWHTQGQGSEVSWSWTQTLPCYHLSHHPLRDTVESFRSRHLQHPATENSTIQQMSSLPRLWEQEQEVPRPIVSNFLESIEKPWESLKLHKLHEVSNSRTSLEQHHLSCAARVMASSSRPLFKRLKMLKWSWDLVETNMISQGPAWKHCRCVVWLEVPM